MKLINVDNFLKQYSDQVCGDTIDAIDLRLALLKEPAVEAIPIKWLDMFMQRYKIQGDDEYKLLHFMVTEWKKWEKENEID